MSARLQHAAPRIRRSGSDANFQAGAARGHIRSAGQAVAKVLVAAAIRMTGTHACPALTPNRGAAIDAAGKNSTTAITLAPRGVGVSFIGGRRTNDVPENKMTPCRIGNVGAVTHSATPQRAVTVWRDVIGVLAAIRHTA